MKFSLILATIDRDREIDSFLSSLVNQDFDNYELIVVDQNQDGKIDTIVDCYKDKININHIKVDFKGVARARNYGIEFCTGDVICFPDDDCEYDIDVLSEISRIFEFNKELAIIAVGSYEFGTNNFSIGANSSKETYFNALKILGIEFTQFFNMKIIDRQDFYMDNRFGISAPYKSAESIELAYRLLKKGLKAFYTPKIKIYHANKDEDYTNYKRVYDYSIGTGAFIRKFMNTGDPYILYYLFRKMLLAPTIKLIIAFITFKISGIKYSYNNLAGIWKGFLLYKDELEQI